MKIVTFNANGIRAAAKKDFFSWFLNQNIDILCIQETKAQKHQLDEEIFNPKGYHRYLFDAEKKGYSGVAIYSKQKPNKVTEGLGFDLADTEGRYIQLDFDNFNVSSIYFPSGTSGDDRQTLKMYFLDEFYKFLEKILKNGKKHVLCGDWNIAHQQIDLKNWKNNQKNSGFLPEERQWFTKMLSLGVIDVFRHKYPDKEQYTWWSNRANAWNNNVGWRIDYQIVTPNMNQNIVDVSVYREEKFSDHAPMIVEYNI